MTILRAGERFVTGQPGIASSHVFSTGPHYDPARLSHGPVIGCDEHLVEAGAGFDWHAHRGVVIVSWVWSGTLRHEDTGGADLALGAGEFLVQSTGDGIRHRETNGSADALRFTQVTLLLDAACSVERRRPPFRVQDVTIGLRPTIAQPGDSDCGERLFAIDGSGEQLTITW